ncbi:MAG: hypothetical protein PHF09_01845, partial [Candidatus Nanoarchaeia archaeon]|nr:hypothetical protein [Candidatus Nanoarchaeia archaeon]
VREGSRIANNNCIVKEINLKDETKKDVKINCPGNTFTLTININSDEQVDDKENSEEINDYLKEAQKNLELLLNSYPNEKNNANSFFGEIALLKQIELTNKNKQIQLELIDLFLKNYPTSKNYEYLQDLKNNYLDYNYSLAENSFKLNNNNYFISFRNFISVDNSNKNTAFSINSVSIGPVNENWKQNYDKGILTLKEIEHDFLVFEFKDFEDKITIFEVYEGEEKEINNLKINIKNINTVRTAHVSLLPVIESDYSKANFTFKIGIEKRLIQISPEVAQDRIESLNKTINSLDKFIEGFDKTLSAWKGTCVTTSAILNAKAFISGFSGEGIARKEIMNYYKTYCDSLISQGDSSFRTREGCYFEHSDEIEQNVKSYKDSLGNVNEIIKDVQKKEGIVEANSIVKNDEYIRELKGKITNPDIDKENLYTVTQVRTALLYQDLLKQDSSCTSVSCDLAEKEYEGSKVNSNLILDDSSLSKGTCSNKFLNPQVRYYDSGKNKGLPSVVPLDLNEGWYTYISNSEGSLIETEVKSYDTSGQVNYFYICNVGNNGNMEYLGGDDLCQGFSSYQSNYDSIRFCSDLNSKEVLELYNKAKEAIISASEQYGKEKVYILGNYFEVGQTMTDSGIFECTDFMSVKDCQIMFNVCDPVLCPSSRCDAGGRYPVSNVPQQGIIGSLVLCWPNKDEGIKIPICLTGINAGLQNLNSVLKQTRQCLQTNIETGEYIGVCDAITSVYFCNLFWEQSSLMINALSSPSNKVTGGVQGGGEYLFAQQNFQNMESALSNYISNYGDELLKAYKFDDFESIGTEFCRNFIGVDLPTKLKNGLGILSEPESPAQFNAYFSESLYEDISVPSRSQYKVTYQIYAGKNEGLSYKVYLKNPPASYINVNPTYEVASGYLDADDGKIDTPTFVTVSGYSTLCVSLNGVESCGFGSVTSSLAGEYIKEKYVEEEVSKNKITTEKDCISSSSSIFNINGKNIELLGITRICASSNPSKDDLTNSEKKWIEVGYCGNENIKCWLDIESVQEDFNAISLESDKSILDSLIYGDSYEKILQEYEDVREEILRLKSSIEEFSFKSLEIILTQEDYLMGSLDKIIGISGEDTGKGTNKDKAEAISLKVQFYQLLYEKSIELTTKSNDISDKVLDEESNVEEEPKIKELEETSIKEESLENFKDGWDLSSNKEIYFNGYSYGYFIEKIGENKYKILNSVTNVQVGIIIDGKITLDKGYLEGLEDYSFDGEKFVLNGNLETNNIQEIEVLDENSLSESEETLDGKMLEKIEYMRTHSTISIIKPSDESFNQLIFPENIDKSQIESLEIFQRYTDYYFTYYSNKWYLIYEFELIDLIDISPLYRTNFGEYSYYINIKEKEYLISKEVYQLISDLRR